METFKASCFRVEFSLKKGKVPNLLLGSLKIQRSSNLLFPKNFIKHSISAELPGFIKRATSHAFINVEDSATEWSVAIMAGSSDDGIVDRHEWKDASIWGLIQVKNYKQALKVVEKKISKKPTDYLDVSMAVELCLPWLRDSGSTHRITCADTLPGSSSIYPVKVSLICQRERGSSGGVGKTYKKNPTASW